MDNRSSPEKQLSSALQYLHIVIVEKRAATDELHANNQELGAVLDGLLTVRGDLKAVISEDGFADFEKPNGKQKVDPKLLDLAELEQQADQVLKKAQSVVAQSIKLRTKSQKVRAALLSTLDGHAKPPVDGHHLDGHHLDGHHLDGHHLDGHRDGASLPVYDNLSKRERQVLTLIVAGKSSKQIAAELGISFKTAVTHRASIMSKMEVHEIASVVREAIRRGLA
jgi:DNA-binding CsgD family transcriptional regulator